MLIQYRKALIFFGLFSTQFFVSACEEWFPPSPYNCENMPEQFRNLEETKVSIFVVWANTNLLASKTELINSLEAVSRKPQKIWLRDPSIKSFTFSDKKRNDGAVISAVFSIEESDPKQLIEIKKLLIPYGLDVAIYAAKKSTPLVYKKTWRDGEESPALISMSFFQKSEGMNKQDFKDYWFCSHTPFALDIHPLQHYERNAVEQVLTEQSSNYDGIVPLYVTKDGDISFAKFFGADGNNPLNNALRIQADVSNFINLDLIETVAMREYVIRDIDRSH